MKTQQLNPQADQLRTLPLPSILQHLGAKPDRYDKHKWHTSQGTLTVNGAKFINWNNGHGGGGAIDLVIHLRQSRFQEALNWLQTHFPHSNSSSSQANTTNLPTKPLSRLALPLSNSSHLQQIKTYLIRNRHLSLAHIQPHLHNGTLYADSRANAVFLHQTQDGIPIGAELRGTRSITWRGLAPGTRKDRGYFATPLITASPDHRPIILCESAIDALSCSAIHPRHHCLSTAGARANPIWLGPLLDQQRIIYCGYDTDPIGESTAHAMIALHPTIKRLRPDRHDWNDDLRSRA